jgi:hypothetical protein
VHAGRAREQRHHQCVCGFHDPNDGGSPGGDSPPNGSSQFQQDAPHPE